MHFLCVLAVVVSGTSSGDTMSEDGPWDYSWDEWFPLTAHWGLCWYFTSSFWRVVLTVRLMDEISGAVQLWLIITIILNVIARKKHSSKHVLFYSFWAVADFYNLFQAASALAVSCLFLEFPTFKKQKPQTLPSVFFAFNASTFANNVETIHCVKNTVQANLTQVHAA